MHEQTPNNLVVQYTDTFNIPRTAPAPDISTVPLHPETFSISRADPDVGIVPPDPYSPLRLRSRYRAYNCNSTPRVAKSPGTPKRRIRWRTRTVYRNRCKLNNQF